LKIVALLVLASLVAGPAAAFGHGGSPITTMPVIGDLIHLFGWYPQALWAVVTRDQYAMASIVERCHGHSFVVELCYGTFGRGVVTVILISAFVAWTVWRVINFLRRKPTFKPA